MAAIVGQRTAARCCGGSRRRGGRSRRGGERFGRTGDLQQLRGERLTAWKALYAHTLGAAQALGLAGEIGHFGAGTIADFAVWRWANDLVQARRQELARDLHEKLFAWLTLGDAHNLAATYVQGRAVYAASPPSA